MKVKKGYLESKRGVVWAKFLNKSRCDRWGTYLGRALFDGDTGIFSRVQDLHPISNIGLGLI